MICKCIAQKIALIITHMSPYFKSNVNRLPSDVPSKMEPQKQIITHGQIDQCGILNKKIPISGTIITYRLV